MNELTRQQYTARGRAEVLRFLDGLDQAGPGLVQVQWWRPETGSARPAAIWAGVARKP